MEMRLMGNIDPNMAGTPDPKDTGDAVVPENGNSDETTAFNPVGVVKDTDNADEGGETDSAKPRPKWLVPIIAAGVAIVVIGAGIGGYAYACNNVNSGVQAASTWNAASAKTLKKTVKDAQALFDKTGEDQVADPQVLEALSSAIDKTKAAKDVELSPNGMLVWELLDAENAYDESTDNILSLDASLNKAIKSVKQSVEDKTLQDAKDALSKAIESAQSTFDGSDGKVQDNTTRDALSKVIDAAKKALEGSDVEAMNTAKSDLDTKTNAVNDSMKAKEQADAEAQAQAEAAANAAASTGSGYSGGYSGGYNSGSAWGNSYGGAPNNGGYPSTGGNAASGGSSTGGGASSGSSDGWDSCFCGNLGSDPVPCEC